MAKLSIDLDDLVSDLCGDLDHEELLELVKQINTEVSDYHFTKELKDYFTKEMEDEDFDMDEE